MTLHSLSASLAIGAAIATMALGIVSISANRAYPHDAIPTATAPLGWQYDYSCCSTLDCSQVQHGGVKVVKEGYQVAITGEVIPWSDKRIKRSKDEFYHRCTPGGKADAPRSLCLYVPDTGF